MRTRSVRLQEAQSKGWRALTPFGSALQRDARASSPWVESRLHPLHAARRQGHPLRLWPGCAKKMSRTIISGPQKGASGKGPRQKKTQKLGSVLGRSDFSRISIFEPPDFFADFVAGFFLLIFVGKSAQKNPPGKSPGKSSKIYTTKILQHISADWPRQKKLNKRQAERGHVKKCQKVSRICFDTFRHLSRRAKDVNQEWPPGKPNQRKVSSWTFHRGIPEQKFDMWILLVFLRKNRQNSEKWAKFMNLSFWHFLWFGLPGRLLSQKSSKIFFDTLIIFARHQFSGPFKTGLWYQKSPDPKAPKCTKNTTTIEKWVAAPQCFHYAPPYF